MLDLWKNDSSQPWGGRRGIKINGLRKVLQDLFIRMVKGGMKIKIHRGMKINSRGYED